MGRPKPLTDSDLRLWAAYSQTFTRLMPGKTRLTLAPDPPAPAPLAATTPPPPRPTPRLLGVDMTPAGLDKSTWKKFASGRIRAEQKLDLHGFTAARAHHAVINFIERAYANQTRCIEIITGKGEILHRELPHWLNAPALRPLILAIAHPHAANTGAVRLLLRRIR